MRGEGNHKIPASFAPENMEKTGAERVKYSLACQHEDAIPIKFVPYAQKCPTVLCTFAVALRKESVDRNDNYNLHCVEEVSVALRKESVDRNVGLSCIDSVSYQSLSARRAWIEILQSPNSIHSPRSLSARRAWIEILIIAMMSILNGSLSARRAWIEITCIALKKYLVIRRSPQGERG